MNLKRLIVRMIIGGLGIAVAIALLFYGALEIASVTPWLWEHFLGEDLVDLLKEAILVFLVWAVGVGALLFFGLSPITLLLWVAIRRFRNRHVVVWTVWGVGFAAIVLLIAIPHYQMSRELLPIKVEFRKAAGGIKTFDIGRDDVGRHVVMVDFGGSLDEVIRQRDRYLAEHQYLPGITINGGWWVSNGSPNVTMVYVYTYLPKAAYNKLIIWWRNQTAPPKTQERQKPQLYSHEATLGRLVFYSVVLPSKCSASSASACAFVSCTTWSRWFGGEYTV